MIALKDKRVMALFFIYAACFGIELTINNIAAIYFKDYFGLGLKTAGLVAGLFGLMNIFARTTGGIIGDKFGERWGLKGRVKWLFIALVIEGFALMLFSRMTVLPIAIGTMIIFSLFVQMSEGATYSVVPFINKKSLGSVSGIVGAGGNMGAVGAGFLFRSEDLSYSNALLILGVIVLLFSFFTFFVKFSQKDEEAAKEEHLKALETRRQLLKAEGKTIKKTSVLPKFFKGFKPLDALRIYLGLALAIKGIYFIIHMQELEMMLQGKFENMQMLIAWFVILAHAVAGVGMAIGFATRWMTAINIPVLLGAIFFVNLKDGLFGGGGTELQFSIFVLFSLILIFWKGSTKFSLDYFLNTDWNAKKEIEK